ncbi:ATP phosphoribosyltransferase [Spirochaetota bacterium]|nr:ATP phosphoribosyltransferase [Spirochaetota bacterium]
MPKLRETSLKLAIPKKGRLRDPAIKLLNKAGYAINDDPRLLHVYHSENDIDFLFLRTTDIPTLIEEGAIDLGITGKDNVLEKQANIHEVMSLEYGHCRLCLAGATPKPTQAKSAQTFSLQTLAKKNVATSFPFLARRFFKEHNIAAPHLIKLSGSLEIMIALKLCEAIIDIVETGSTLKENQLQIHHTIGHYYAALYTRNALVKDKRVILMKKRLTSALLAQNYRIIEYNIKKQLLNRAEAISPGFDSPTISHLDDPDRVAVKILVKKSNVFAIMDKLEAIGATAIFETEIKNCRL